MARSSSSGWLTAGVTHGFLVCGGSLASVIAQRLQQFFRITGYQKSLGYSPRLLIPSLAKSSFRERIQRELSVVDLLAVNLLIYSLARKLAARGTREKVARLMYAT